MKRLAAVLCALLLIITQSADARRQTPQKNKGYVPTQWSGFFVGAQMGEAWNESDWEYNNANYFNTNGPTVLGNTFTSNTNGIAGGGFLGYNYQAGHALMGVEASFSGSDINNTFNSPFFPNADRYTAKMGYYATAKGRLGYAVQKWLLSANGGWAGSQLDLTLNDTFAGIKANSNQWVNGWVAGAGLDYMFMQHFTLGLAYDYILLNLDNTVLDCSGCGTGVGFGAPVVNGNIVNQVGSLRFSYFFK